MCMPLGVCVSMCWVSLKNMTRMAKHNIGNVGGGGGE